MACFNRASTQIVRSMEGLFFCWGCLVSRHPAKVILTCLLLTAAAAVGLLRFRVEHKANMLWIPANSTYNTNQEWLNKHFKKTIRKELMILKSENVLTPHSIKKMMEIHTALMEMKVDGKSFEDICTRIPVADPFLTRRKREAESRDILSQKQSMDTKEPEKSEVEEDYYDIWDDYSDYPDDEVTPQIYVKPRVNFQKFSNKQNSTLENLPQDIQCDLVSSLNEKCAEFSLLEIWGFNPLLVEGVTQDEILRAVNLLQRSPVYGHNTDFSEQLGGVVRNSTGHIIGAETARMLWSISVPEDAVIVESQGSGIELELGDALSLAWEEGFIEMAQRLGEPGIEILPNAVKSYGAESERAIYFDTSLMAGGYCLMFLYTVLMLGRLTWLECRLWLAVVGILSILLGLVVAMGLSSLLSLPYTPMHAILPFLCLGIGIDDMFVIMQCLSNIKKKKRTHDLGVPELIGSALRHAGVSLTVTTVTDVSAFAVGAVTLMPGLQSFCVTTALALAAIYLLQVSWFTAWLALDEKRIRNGQHSILPCISLSQTTESTTDPNQDRLRSLLLWLLPLWSYQAVVVLVSALLLGVSAWGATGIRQKFDPFLLIPQDSYMTRFIQVNDEFYNPYRGWKAEMYTGPLHPSDLPSLDSLVRELEELPHLESVTSWWTEFRDWAGEQGSEPGSWRNLTSDSHFPSALSEFLHSVRGARYQPDFRFSGELVCGEAAPSILASKFYIEYHQFLGPEEHVPAKQAVERALEKSKIHEAFSFVKIYAAWETDQIIGHELWRNVLLALACVTAVVLLLLANIKICLLVVLTIVLTLTDIVGFLHFWGITIDIISCINIVLAIGLCVDYSVHICHAFLLARGNKRERAVTAVVNIGPAVMNGGVTTFLALVLLGGSTSHTFLTFFKVFVLTVIFGLFHGLVLLPVLLLLVGPAEIARDEEEDEETVSEGSSGGHSNLGYVEEKGGVLGQAWAHLFPRQGSWSPQPSP